VRSGPLVSGAERLAIGTVQIAGHVVRVAILVTIVHIGIAMIRVVLVGAFDAVVVSTALYLVVFLWGNIPSLLRISCIECRRRKPLRVCARQDKEKCCCGYHKPVACHGLLSFCLL
jgi:hypothetical protein